MAKIVNTYRLIVDYYKYPKHSTSGGYDVAAKSPEEAVEMLQKAIGFGSVQVLYAYTASNEDNIILKGKAAKLCGTRKFRMYHTDETRYLLPYGTIERVGDVGTHHACSPRKTATLAGCAGTKRSFKYGHDRYAEM